MTDGPIAWRAAVPTWAAAVLVIMWALGAGPAGAGAATAREAAPDVTLDVLLAQPMYGLDAPRTPLAALRGQVVVMAFVDESCPGCDRMADLIQFAGAGSGVLALGVASGVDRAAARRIATKKEGRGRRGIPMVTDPDGALARAFGVTRLPALVVVDRRGRIAARRDAPLPFRRVDAFLETFVDEPLPRVLPSAPRLLVPVSVLRRPVTRGLGPLPSFLRPPGRFCPWVRGSLRLAARSPSERRLVVGRALDGGVVASLVDPRGDSGSVSCGLGTTEAGLERAALRMRRSGLVTSFASGGGTRPPVHALVVVDGYDRVRYGGRIVEIQDNGVILEGFPAADSAVLEGPAGRRTVRFPRAVTPRAVGQAERP